ncbi:hypothetical protein ZWY2020_006276 [Hordeum vulgare]|nr:hypothetical protein ZWY2020_006276 [Hordeum vulgare]
MRAPWAGSRHGRPPKRFAGRSPPRPSPVVRSLLAAPSLFSLMPPVLVDRCTLRQPGRRTRTAVPLLSPALVPLRPYSLVPPFTCSTSRAAHARPASLPRLSSASRSRPACVTVLRRPIGSRSSPHGRLHRCVVRRLHPMLYCCVRMQRDRKTGPVEKLLPAKNATVCACPRHHSIG